jgi:ATP-dependent RNA helicase SUPV3L1/SUV3
LQDWIDGVVARDLGPLFAVALKADGDPALRGPLHRLLESGGVVAGDLAGEMDGVTRGRLKAVGVRAGRFALYLPEMLKPRAVALRARLWAIQARVSLPELPEPGLVSITAPAHAPPGFLAAMGWVSAGPVLLRLDIAERVAAGLAFSTRGKPAPIPLQVGQHLGVRTELLPAVLRGLGLRILPAPSLTAEHYGPPPPPMMAQQRRRPAARTLPSAPPRADHPFAALAALRR